MSMKNRLNKLLYYVLLNVFFMFIGVVVYSNMSIHREMKIYGMTTSAIEADIRACEVINNTKCKVSLTIIDTKIKK